MNYKKHKLAPYTFIAPFFLLFISFYLFPMIYSFIISLTHWDGINKMEFVGLKNYIRLFTNDPVFYKSILNTVKIIAITNPLQLVIGFFVAVLLKDFFFKKRVFFQFMNYSPNLTTPVAIGILFAVLFDSRIGAVNDILMKLGIIKENVYWLNTKGTARFVLILVMTWRYYGYNMLIILAGLSGISESLYEAAKIDGANWWQTTIKIVIPSLKNTFLFLITTGIIYGLQIFDVVLTLFKHAGQPYGGPGKEFLTSIMYIYDTAFRRFDLGYGAAMSYGLFIIIMVISLANLKRIVKGNKL